MCNLYALTKGQDAIRQHADIMRGHIGNSPSLPGIFPDYCAPIVRLGANGVRELHRALGHALAGFRARRPQGR